VLAALQANLIGKSLTATATATANGNQQSPAATLPQTISRNNPIRFDKVCGKV